MISALLSDLCGFASLREILRDLVAASPRWVSVVKVWNPFRHPSTNYFAPSRLCGRHSGVPEHHCLADDRSVLTPDLDTTQIRFPELRAARIKRLYTSRLRAFAGDIPVSAGAVHPLITRRSLRTTRQD